MAANASEEAPVFVIIDSDEESTKQVKRDHSDSNSRSQFDEFVTVSNSLLTKIRDGATAEKIKKHLLKVFKSAKPDYISSEEFLNTVQQHLTELRKPDIKDQAIFTVVHDVIIHLKNASSKAKKKKRDRVNSDAEVNKDGAEDGGLTRSTVNIKTEAESDGAEPCGSKNGNNYEPMGEIDKEEATSSKNTINLPSNSKEMFAKKSTNSKSSSISSNGDKPSSSQSDTADKSDKSDKSKRHKIRRMEKLMGKLDKEIRRYGEKELTIEEMERDDSSHMIEHKLRKRFIEAWKKWCKLKGYEAKTGRGIEKKVQYEGTRYPEINLKIRKLVKHNKFPDFHDVHRVIWKTNQSKNLGIHKHALKPLATEVFRDIGEKLSKRRINDYMYNPGYASLLDAPDDPASENPDLKARLEENAARGKMMMDNVLEKYTNMARELHAPGVEPDFDRTSDPEVPPDSSDEEIEGEWIEYVSDSDENQSAEPSVTKSREEESACTKMEVGPLEETSQESKTEDSKKHHLEVDGLSDDGASEKKRIKLDQADDASEENEKDSASIQSIPSSSADVKSDSDLKKNQISHSSQGPVNKAASATCSSPQVTSEADVVTISSEKLVKCSVRIPQIKVLPSLTSSTHVPLKIQPPKINCEPSRGTSAPAKSSGLSAQTSAPAKSSGSSAQTKAPAKSSGSSAQMSAPAKSSGPAPGTSAPAKSSGPAPQTSAPAKSSGPAPQTSTLVKSSGPSQTSTPAKSAVSRKELTDVLAAMEPVKLMLGGVNHQNTSAVGSTSTGSITTAATSKTLQLARPTTTGTAFMNNKAPTRRIQLNSQPLKSSVSLTKNKVSSPRPPLNSGASSRVVSLTNSTAQSRRVQSNPRPSVSNLSSAHNLARRSQPTSQQLIRSTNPNNIKTQSARMQVNSRPSVGNTSVTDNSSHRYRDQFNAMQSIKTEPTKNGSPTNGKSLSARMQIGSNPSTNTKAGARFHQEVCRSMNANGKVVKVTRTLMPNQRVGAASNQATARQVNPVGKKTFIKHPPVKQSNGSKTTFHEDDDGVIVLD